MKKLLILSLTLVSSYLGAVTPSPSPTPTVLPTPQETYSAKRTYLVDSNASNNTYLFRGNQPLNADGSFAYTQIATKVSTLAGINLSNYKFVDLSIIDNTPGSNRGDLADEFYNFGFSSSFFNVTISPSVWPPYSNGFPVTKMWGTSVAGFPGSIVWYPVQGCPTIAVCGQQENTYFGFNKEVDFLANFLATQKNSVLYFHCLHGHDRTSALHAGYLLKYKKATLNQVLTQKPPKGAMGFKHAWEADYKTLVTWYAGYLTQTAK
jgi:hypothetical protein